MVCLHGDNVNFFQKKNIFISANYLLAFSNNWVFLLFKLIHFTSSIPKPYFILLVFYNISLVQMTKALSIVQPMLWFSKFTSEPFMFSLKIHGGLVIFLYYKHEKWLIIEKLHMLHLTVLLIVVRKRYLASVWNENCMIFFCSCLVHTYNATFCSWKWKD